MSRFALATTILLALGLSSTGCGTRGVLGSGFPGLVFRGGSSAGNNQSGQSVGSCCLLTGDCLTITASDCGNYGGTFYGPGLICEFAPCINLY